MPTSNSRAQAAPPPADQETPQQLARRLLGGLPQHRGAGPAAGPAPDDGARLQDPPAGGSESAQQRALRIVGADIQRRSMAKVQRDAIDVEARTVEIAWASEFAGGERYYGVEVLDCTAKSIRLGRLEDGAALLFNHRSDQLIGVVESVQIGADRVCRAKVRFDDTPESDVRFQQVRNGVLRHVSVGYMVHAMELEKDEEGVKTYRITDWEPYELSFVAIPFDPDVGVGRAATSQTVPPVQASARTATIPAIPLSKDKRNMDELEQQQQEQARLQEQQRQQQQAADRRDIQRRDAIMALGQQYADYLTVNDLQTACRDGHTTDKVQSLVIERMAAKHSDTRGAHIGLSQKDIQRYSISNALRAMLTGDWKGAGLEREASEAAAKRFGMGSKGLLLPFDVMAQRDFTVGTAAEAGNLVQTQLRDDLFADVLRNRLALSRLGATMLFGLSSNIDIPRKASGAALGFVTEVAAAAETQPNTGKVSLTPKRIGGFIEFSKQAVIQSSLAVEPLLRQDILSEYQVQFETAGLNGTGAGANPRGLRNTAGIGSVAGGTNGAQLSWAHIVALESACANVNAEPDQYAGYLVNTKTRGWCKTAQKAANLPFIWDNGAQPLNGYRAEVSNIVPSNLTKGTSVGNCSSIAFSSNWQMLVLASFGAVEILVDETSLAPNGMNRLILNAFVDAGARRTADFSVMDDALTQ